MASLLQAIYIYPPLCHCDIKFETIIITTIIIHNVNIAHGSLHTYYMYKVHIKCTVMMYIYIHEAKLYSARLPSLVWRESAGTAELLATLMKPFVANLRGREGRRGWIEGGKKVTR